MGSSSSISPYVAVVVATLDQDLDRDGVAALSTGIDCLSKGELIEDERAVLTYDGW